MACQRLSSLGTPHTFANLSDEPVCTVGVITPSGLENMFAEIAAYLPALTGPPDPQTITAINAKYGVSPADGPRSASTPARTARAPPPLATCAHAGAAPPWPP
jgi:hypothetical protein